MTQTVKLNGSKLHSIAHSSHSAEVTMTALALRERNRHSSDIGRTRTALIRAGEKIVDEEYRKFWTDLESEGVGTIVYGRHGNPDRFEWHYALKMIADAALTGKDLMADRTTVEPNAKQAKNVTSKSIKKAKLSNYEKKDKVEHTVVSSAKSEKLFCIPLRKDFFVDISLPSDVSKDEIEVIQRALKRASA